MPLFENLDDIAEEIEAIRGFGDAPLYAVKTGEKHLYVCRNDGVLHKGDRTGEPGFATFVGKFTFEHACEDWGCGLFWPQPT